jgi:hypothetical protein
LKKRPQEKLGTDHPEHNGAKKVQGCHPESRFFWVKGEECMGIMGLLVDSSLVCFFATIFHLKLQPKKGVKISK